MKSIVIALLMVILCATARASEVNKDSAESQIGEQETNDLSDICESTEAIYTAKKQIEKEKKIGKISGAVDLDRLNEEGRKVVRNQEEGQKLFAEYKRKYKSDPDLSRCRFIEEMDPSEKDRLSKESTPPKKPKSRKEPTK